MTEELVTLETAKLLKEKGFKEDVSVFYELVCKEGSYEYELFESYDAQNYNASVYSFSAPTQYIAQKWLRETKNLHIEITYIYRDYWSYDILTIPNHGSIGLSGRPLVHYKSYEEVLEAGIQEALKLI
jgi:hypothetical protein